MADPGYFYSINTIPGNGTQTVFEISFAGGYISREHIKAYTARPGSTNVDTALEWMGPNTVRIAQPTPIGSTLVIYRDTPKDKPLADFNDGAVVTETNLDTNAKQSVFIAAEVQDTGVFTAERSLRVPVGTTVDEILPLVGSQGVITIAPSGEIAVVPTGSLVGALDQFDGGLDGLADGNFFDGGIDG